MKKSYQYYDDGRIKFTQDQLTTNSKFDRLYKYDHVGRTTIALSGAEARGQGPTDDRPYNETMAYDALGHLTLRELRHWDRYDTTGNQTYVNNRRQGWQYDADGRLLTGPSYYAYDAAGRISTFGDGDPYETDQQFDGDGRRLKTTLRSFDPNTSQWTTEKVTYYIHSSVIGELISEVSAQGAKERSFVFAGGQVMAIQTTSGGQFVGWEHYDASGASYRPTDSQGQLGFGGEMDPMGANAGIIKPLTWPEPTSPGKVVPYYGISDLNSPTQGCEWAGIPAPCRVVVGLGGGSRGPFGLTFDGDEVFGPMIDWHPWFVAWVRAKGHNVTIDNYGELGSEWLNFLAFGAPFDEAGIMQLVIEILTSERCANFANTVLNAQKRKGLGTLDEVAKSFFALSGPHFTRRRPLGSVQGIANPIGRIAQGTAQIFIVGNDPYRSAADQMVDDADFAIGELFHLAAEGSWYSDEEMARAVKDSTYASDANKLLRDGLPMIDPRSNPFDQSYVADKNDPYDREHSFSRYFHAIQHLYCSSRPGVERGIRFRS